MHHLQRHCMMQSCQHGPKECPQHNVGSIQWRTKAVLSTVYFVNDFSSCTHNVSVFPLAEILIRADRCVSWLCGLDHGPVGSLMRVLIVGVALWKMTTCLPEIKSRIVEKSKRLRRVEGEMETFSVLTCYLTLFLLSGFLSHSHTLFQTVTRRSVAIGITKCYHLNVIRSVSFVCC